MGVTTGLGVFLCTPLAGLGSLLVYNYGLEGFHMGVTTGQGVFLCTPLAGLGSLVKISHLFLIFCRVSLMDLLGLSFYLPIFHMRPSAIIDVFTSDQ